MTNDKMPNITLSMSDQDQDKLKKIADRERRSLSKQVIVMMEFYEECHKDKVK